MRAMPRLWCGALLFGMIGVLCLVVSVEINVFVWLSGARLTKYLTIMPKFRSTYDGRLIYKTSYTMNGKLFIGLGKIHVQNRNIVGDSARELADDIPGRNFSKFSVTIVSRSYDKLEIILSMNRKIFCKWGSWTTPWLRTWMYQHSLLPGCCCC